MRLKSILLTALVLALAGPAACAPAEDGPTPLSLERSVDLKGVDGRIDHLAVDASHRRVFIAELGAGAVEAIDLDRGASLGRIAGLKAPQGLAYLPALDQLAVASGGDGAVRFYTAVDLRLLGAVAVGDDADDLRIDPKGRVVVGYGSGGLAVIDPVSRRIVAKLALAAHPEGFELIGDEALVNLPGARQITRGDLAEGRLIANWRVGPLLNFPMALAADKRTIAVAFRLPARLQLLDAATGNVTLDRATCGDADDVFFDDPRRRLYVICGAGEVDVVALTGQSRPLRTRPGARTGLFVPQWDRLLIAARANAGQAATLLVYRPN